MLAASIPAAWLVVGLLVAIVVLLAARRRG